MRSGGGRILVFTALYVFSATICCLLAAHQQAQFVDLHVYRLGGEAVLHGRGLYKLRYLRLPFTYPPFAALAFTGLAVLPWGAVTALTTAGNAIALVVMLYLALRLPPAAKRFDDRTRWLLALGAGTAAIWLEPVRTALAYGQIDLLIALCVLYDLSLPDHARRKGIAIGLAAGLKLTPAIFALYLLCTRRYRAAATAAVTFAATIAAGWIVTPAGSAVYWDGTFVNPGHVGQIQDAENQSLLGALARNLHTPHVTWLWLPLAGLVALAGLGLATRAARSGDQALGFSLCAITGLLISPISWTHHWVIAVPALLLAGVAVYPGRAGRALAATIVACLALAAILVVGWARIARDIQDPDWLHLSPAGIAASEIYVIAGLAALAVAAVRLARRPLKAGDLPALDQYRASGGSAVAPDRVGSGAQPRVDSRIDRGSPGRDTDPALPD